MQGDLEALGVLLNVGHDAVSPVGLTCRLESCEWDCCRGGRDFLSGAWRILGVLFFTPAESSVGPWGGVVSWEHTTL